MVLSSRMRSRSRTTMRRITLAEQDRLVVTLQTCGVVDHFDGRALPKIGLGGPGVESPRRIKIDIGIGDGDLDMRAMRLHPIDDRLRPKFRAITGRFIEHGISYNDRDIRIQQIIELSAAARVMSGPVSTTNSAKR